MSHVENYRQNEDYADFLETWDESFFAKYADTLASNPLAGDTLDVGCGVGQVVKRLRDQKHPAFGVDVSEPNIRKANELAGSCQLYDGQRLPFPDNRFSGVGAFNVLEHVDEPESFLHELVRVLRPNGRLVVSSPNFLRVLGFKDYHPRMRGFRSKWKNARQLYQIAKQIRQEPDQVRFERMPPIVKEPFTPDDDAIVATNPLHMRFFIKKAGCQVLKSVCTDRYVPGIVEWGLNLPILKDLWFNAFIIAKKHSE